VRAQRRTPPSARRGIADTSSAMRESQRAKAQVTPLAMRESQRAKARTHVSQGTRAMDCAGACNESWGVRPSPWSPWPDVG